MTSIRPITLFSVATLLVAFVPSTGAAEISPTQPIATFGTETITAGAFVQQVQTRVRQRFYHGKIPDKEIEKFGNEVLQGMIERGLLLREAHRRELKPDNKSIDAEVASYDKQYSASERWQQERLKWLPLLRTNLEQESLLHLLEAQVRQLPPPAEQQVHDYYQHNPDKFTTPEKLRVSLILLKVEPSSPAAAWKKALEDGAAIVDELQQGGDFAALAKLHSGHESTGKGGDLGYIHQGMLAPEAQQAIAKLKPGEIAEPIRVLQGVAILRLEDRTIAKLNPFEQVRERAGELLLRDSGDVAWRALTERLRQQTTIAIDNQALEALFTPATAPELVPMKPRSGEQK